MTGILPAFIRQAAPTISRSNATPPLVAAGALAIAPMFLSDYESHLVVVVMAFAIAVVGLDLIIGRLGLISFGQSAFLAIGAYGTVILVTQFHVQLWVALAVAVGTSGAVGALVALLAIRLPGFSFAFVTFGLGYVVQTLLEGSWLLPWTGGQSGLFVPKMDFIIDLSNGLGLYYSSLVLLCAGMLVAANLAGSRAGRALTAIKESEPVALSLGIPVGRYKVWSFALGSTYAAVAGALLAQATQYVSPPSYGVNESITLVAMLILGGLGRSIGPLVGAAFFVLTPEYLQGTQDSSPIVFSIALLAALILAPRGVVGSIDTIVRQKAFRSLTQAWERRRDRRKGMGTPGGPSS